MSFSSFRRFVQLTGSESAVEGGPWPEDQQSDYESGLVRLGDELWRLRTARVTPTKPGAFVAVWERDENGATRPFIGDGTVRGLLVFVADEERFGVFRFDATQLDRLGVTRSSSRPGKRGFRVYPVWSLNLNPQAQRAQRVQAASFLLLE